MLANRPFASSEVRFVIPRLAVHDLKMSRPAISQSYQTNKPTDQRLDTFEVPLTQKRCRRQIQRMKAPRWRRQSLNSNIQTSSGSEV